MKTLVARKPSDVSGGEVAIEFDLDMSGRSPMLRARAPGGGWQNLVIVQLDQGALRLSVRSIYDARLRALLDGHSGITPRGAHYTFPEVTIDNPQWEKPGDPGFITLFAEAE